MIFEPASPGLKIFVPCIGFLYFRGTRQLSNQQIYNVCVALYMFYFSPSCGLFCNLFTYRITYINSSSQKFVIPKGLLSWKLKKVIRYPKLSFQKVTCRYLYRLLVLDTVKRNNSLTPSTFLQNRVGQKLLRSREGLLSEYRTSNKSLMLCK